MIKWHHVVGALFFVVGAGGSVDAKEKDLPLGIVTQNYAHTRLIQDGTIKIPGCEIRYQTLSLSAIRAQAGEKHFDVMEVELIPFLARLADGQPQEYTLIPVFLLREFPLRDLWVRADRGIKSPQDLRGKRVAVDDYRNNGAAWIRRFLQSSATVTAEDIIWVDIAKDTAPHQSLVELIQGGRVDATIHPGEPGNTKGIVRLFPNYAQVEQDLFKESRVFPLATALAVRLDLVKENPWLPEALFIGFVEAKRQAIENLGTEKEPKIPLPWGPDSYRVTLDLMGKNYWSYGVPNNPRSLKALLEGALDQGLLKRPLNVEEIFDSSTLQLTEQ